MSRLLAVLTGAATLALAAMPSTALAAKGPAEGPRLCALSDITPNASDCAGFSGGNLLSNATVAQQQTALADIGFTWDGDFGAVTKIASLNGATTVDFGKTLFGDTFVGLHFGNGAGLGGQATAFYKFDAGSTGIAGFLLGIAQGSSGAVLYSTGTAPVLPPIDGGGGGGLGAVPEPATWAMLMIGFGLAGTAMRRRGTMATVSA